MMIIGECNDYAYIDGGIIICHVFSRPKSLLRVIEDYKHYLLSQKPKGSEVIYRRTENRMVKRKKDKPNNNGRQSTTRKT